MKNLPAKLRKNGFDYIRVKEGRRSYVYAQMVSERQTAYEVFIKRVRPSRNVNGIELPEAQAFPHKEAFGKWAWSFYTLEKALLKFKELEGTTGNADIKSEKG